MAKYASEDIRNITFIGGSDSGKTSLVDALLFKSGAATRLGKVDDETSLSDFDPDEKSKKHSLSLSLLYATHMKKQINILDTPGYPDFIGDAISSLYAAETAVIAINAFNGIVYNTRRMWDEATRLGLAKVITINKLDIENIEWDTLLDNIKDAFGQHCHPVIIPDGTGQNLSTLVNCLFEAESAPDSIKDAAEEACLTATETLVESNDELMEKYLEGEKIGKDEIKGLLRTAIREGTFVPILCTCVEKDLGVGEILDFVAEFAPSPIEGPFRKALKDEEEILLDPKEYTEPVATVFKSITDPYVGKLNYVRVLTGNLSVDSVFYNSRTEKTEKIGTLLRSQGKETESIPEGVAGDIVVIPKVETLELSDSLCLEKSKITIAPMEHPLPMVSLAVTPKSRNDEQKISTALRKLNNEDPTFNAGRDATTGEMVVTGISMLHLETLLRRLKTRFKVDVETKLPKVAYRETIRKAAEGHHKHRKQTGGHGQYAEVKLILEPVERGEGFVFSDEIVGGVIPRQYIPAVEKGIREILDQGILAGYPVVDAKARIIDGSYHDVDSSEASFKMAAAKAFRDAFGNAGPVLLEPVVFVDVAIPSRFMGDVNGDLNSRGARIQGMDSMGDLQTIKALVPLREVQQYSTELRSITSGEGSYTITFSHYDPVPSQKVAAIIAQSKKDDEE
jgi:elongation factor G